MDVLTSLINHGSHPKIRSISNGKVSVLDSLMYLNNCHDPSPKDNLPSALACFNRIKSQSDDVQARISYVVFPGRSRQPSPVAEIDIVKQCLSLRLQGARFPMSLKQQIVQDLQLPTSIPMKSYIEEEVIPALSTALAVYDAQLRYHVGPFYIDMYLTECKIAVECDEHCHSYYDVEEERRREDYIKSTLGCRIYRFNPHAQDFNIFRIISEILCLISGKELPTAVDQQTSGMAANSAVPTDGNAGTSFDRNYKATTAGQVKRDALALMYEEISLLNDEEFEKVSRVRRGTHTSHQLAALEKHLFIKWIIQSYPVSYNDQKRLFDGYRENDSMHRKWLFNAYHNLRTETAVSMREKLTQLKYIDISKVDDAISVNMHSVCKILGMKHIHDTDIRLSRNDIEDSIRKLHPHLKSLRVLSGKKENHNEDFRSVTDLLRTLFKDYYGIRFENIEKNTCVSKSQRPRQKAISYALSFVDSFAQCVYTSGLV